MKNAKKKILTTLLEISTQNFSKHATKALYNYNFVKLTSIRNFPLHFSQFKIKVFHYQLQVNLEKSVQFPNFRKNR